MNIKIRTNIIHDINSNIKIPPALWATGGLERSCQSSCQSSNQLYQLYIQPTLPTLHPINSSNFTTNSTTKFPGGVVYPSSFLLPGLQNRPAARTRRLPYSTLLPSWSSSFFHHFFNMFLIDFGSILAPKMAPKSTKNPFKIYLKTRSKKSLLLGPIFHYF